MNELLFRKFVKDCENVKDSRVRDSYGKLAGAVGIVSNSLLCIMKIVIGWLSGSIAIVADGINNLADASSSVITLIGFRLAALPEDDEHPYGHARIEYLAGMAVSVMIILVGVELGKSSIEKIISPEPLEFSWVLAAVLLLAIVIKIWQARFNIAAGKRIDSLTLIATGADSRNDVISTSVVLLGVLVGHFAQVQIDGYLGLAVAIFILWSGINAVKDTLDPLLGTPPTHEFVQRIRDLVMAHGTILGIHDLIVHDYGPGRVMISLHAEVPANEDVLALHDEIDNVEKELREKLGCDAVIHMDPVVTDDGVTEETRHRVQTLVHCIDDAIDIHDFRMVSGPTHTNLIFDAVVPFGFRLTDQEVEEKIRKAVRALDGNYYAVVNVERSYT